VRAGAFARELELDRLEALAAESIGDYLRARWRDRGRLDERSPPLPELLSDPAMRRSLEGWRAESRRAEMLWRWCALAAVETDPRVRDALAARDGGALAAARNEAARRLGRRSYWHLGLELAELAGLPEDTGAEPASPSPQPVGELSVDAIADALASAGLPVAGVALDIDLSERTEQVRARTFPVAPPEDVRVYVRAPAGPVGWRAVAHELGHAVYARHHGAGRAWSMRAAPSRALHEGIAFFAEALILGPDEEAIAAQRRRALAEQQFYDGAADSARPWMFDDPMAQPAYLAGHAVARALGAATRAFEGAALGAWLIEHLLEPGASEPMAVLLDRAGVCAPV